MNILFIGQKNKGWMYETLHNEQQALEKEINKDRGSVFYFGPGHKHCKNLDFNYFCTKNKISTKNIDLIIFYISHYTLKTGKTDTQSVKFYNCPSKNYLKQLDDMNKIPRILWLNDFWQMNKFERIISENRYKISHLLSTYFYHLDEPKRKKYFMISKYPKNRIFHISRSVNVRNIAYKKRQNKEIDILMLGAIDDFYPERKKYLNLLKNTKNINFFYRSHPGYDFQKKINKNHIFGEKYFKTLRNAKIFVTCGTKLNLPIIKLYEILASNCLLMCGKINNLNKIGLINGKNFIKIKEKDLLKKIKYFLKNGKQRKLIAKNGLELIKNKFTNQIQARKQYKIIKLISEKHVPIKLLNNFELIIITVYVLIYRFLKFMKNLLL
jgi:hypothetical protein